MKRNQKGLAHLGILLVLIVIAVVGVVGYYVYNKSKDDKKTTQTVVTDTPANTTAQTETTKPNETKSTIEPTYIPQNLFTDTNKSELDKKLVQPNIDYAEQYKGKEGYDPIASITITKKTDAEYAAQQEYAKYRYSVKIVSKSGATNDFMFGEKDIIGWWLPECYDGKCGLTESFKTKYPEIVSQLKTAGNTP